MALKGFVFFLLTLLIAFSTAAGTLFILFEVVTPFIKTYPGLRGIGILGPLLHALPWFIDILGALLVAGAGYFFLQNNSLQKRAGVFILLLFIALVIAWPAGSVSNIASTVGWSEIFLFPFNFWIAIVMYGLEMFDFIAWRDALMFLSSAVLIFCLLIKKYVRTQ
ncbi:MAG: hypothetical protein Q7R54_03065 [bacterium]|nr:hypothetical protein [bacterium]